MNTFNGLGLHLGNLSLLSHAKTRSISAENPTGEKGGGGMAADGPGAEAATDLGQGWKVAPASKIKAGETSSLRTSRDPAQSNRSGWRRPPHRVSLWVMQKSSGAVSLRSTFA